MILGDLLELGLQKHGEEVKAIVQRAIKGGRDTMIHVKYLSKDRNRCSSDLIFIQKGQESRDCELSRTQFYEVCDHCPSKISPVVTTSVYPENIHRMIDDSAGHACRLLYP